MTVIAASLLRLHLLAADSVGDSELHCCTFFSCLPRIQLVTVIAASVLFLQLSAIAELPRAVLHETLGKLAVIIPSEWGYSLSIMPTIHSFPFPTD